jgi:hypothetical protein
MSIRLYFFASALGAVAVLAGAALADDDIDPNLVRRGFEISPIPSSQLSLSNKSAALVGYGSFLVNAMGDCSGCHTFPQYYHSPPGAPGDPYEGTPSTQSVNGRLVANFNAKHYLAGGQCFGPFMARNLTPDSHGLPEGLTEAEFVRVMRLGEDVHCEPNKYPMDSICGLGPPTAVLQVMPWPTYHSMTDQDLKAIYAYLSALPAANACNSVKDGCPGFSGAAASSAKYAYKNTAECPNPAPPQ